MYEISLKPISVMTDGGSHEGRLVFADGSLVGVLARVGPQETAGGERQGGGWFLEAGFGPCSTLMAVTPPVFATQDEAVAWIREQLETRLSTS